MRRLLYRNFRLVSAVTWELGRRLTPAGRLVAAAALAAAIVGPNPRLTVAYQAFTFLVALLVVAGLGALVRPPRLEVRRRLPRYATVGEPLAYRVGVRNPTARAQTGLTLLEDLGDPRPSYEEFRAAREPGEERRNWFDRTVGYPRWAWLVAQNRRGAVGEQPLPALPPGGEAEARMTLTPLRRGRLTFRGVAVARADPLGLVRALTPLRLPDSVLVLPRRYPVPPFELPGGRRYQRGGVALASSVGDSEEFLSLREYRPGDPLKRVHWRSWARTGRPIVREHHDEFFVRHALVLDTFAPFADRAFEEAVSVAASLASSVGTQDSLLDLMFVGPRAYVFTAGRGVGQVDRMLEVLAGVAPCRDRPFEDLTRLLAGRHGELSGAVCVLLAWDDARRALLGRLRALGVPALALVVADGPDDVLEEGVRRLRPGRVAEGLARL